MYGILKRIRPFDAALVVFLAAVGFMTYGEGRSPRPVMPEPVIRMQDATRGLIASVFTPPVSTWVSGLLLGDDHAFSEEWKEAFRRTGTSHLTAVSGYNIAVLIAVLGSAAGSLPLSRSWRVVCGSVAVILFVLLTGTPASVVRAAGMAGIALVARLAGRAVRPVRALFLAVAIMVAARPALLLHDLGFQLSALATFGLVVFTPVLMPPLSRVLPASLAEPVAQTTAATVTVSPLIAAAFGTFSVVTLPVNVVVGAAVPVMMAVSGVLLAVSAVSLPVAQVLAGLSAPVFMLPLRVIAWAGNLPHAEVTGGRALLAASALALAVASASVLSALAKPYVEEV